MKRDRSFDGLFGSDRLPFNDIKKECEEEGMYARRFLFFGCTICSVLVNPSLSGVFF